MFPEWPGNEDAKHHDFKAGFDGDESKRFTDDFTVYLPPSFKEFMRDQNNWLRPSEYIREIIHEEETNRLKKERR